MSEERLQEIKDSLNAQYKIAKSDNKYQSVYFVLDEEKELIEEIKRLNNIIKRLENEISGAYTDLSNNLNVNYMHEAFKKDLLKILGDKENE